MLPPAPIWYFLFPPGSTCFRPHSSPSLPVNSQSDLVAGGRQVFPHFCSEPTGGRRAKSNPDVRSVFRTCSKLSWTKPICFTAPVDLPSYSKLKIKVLKVALGAQQKPIPSDLPLGTSPRPPCMPGAPLSWTSSPKPPEGAWLLESPPGPRASPRLPSWRGLPSLALLLSPNTLYPLPSATAPTWRMQHPLAGLRPGSPWKRKLPKAGTLSLFADLLMT